MTYKDNWATLYRGPICQRCNLPKLDHGYYLGAYQCMSLHNSVFTEKPGRKITSPLTIKKEGMNKMAKEKIVKMPKTSKTESKSKPKPSVKSEKKVTSKFIGKHTGLGVSDFQNKTILGNKGEHLTDIVIAKMWKSEFPHAKPYTEKDVSNVRSAFNKGKHNNDAPAKPILEYGRDGNPIKDDKESSSTPKRSSKKTTVKADSKSTLKKKKMKEEDEEEDESSLDVDSTEEDEEE